MQKMVNKEVLGRVPCDPTGTMCAITLLAIAQSQAAPRGWHHLPSRAHASSSQESCSRGQAP